MTPSSSTSSAATARPRPPTTPSSASGANATILHYVDNAAELQDGDLLLIDAGAEYEGFASDITRTFPVNGRFNDAQRDIYQLVLDCQEECIRMVRPGVTLEEMHERSVEILTEGMVRLGLLKGEPEKLIEEERVQEVLHAPPRPLPRHGRTRRWAPTTSKAGPAPSSPAWS